MDATVSLPLEHPLLQDWECHWPWRIHSCGALYYNSNLTWSPFFQPMTLQVWIRAGIHLAINLASYRSSNTKKNVHGQKHPKELDKCRNSIQCHWYLRTHSSRFDNIIDRLGSLSFTGLLEYMLIFIETAWFDISPRQWNILILSVIIKIYRCFRFERRGSEIGTILFINQA